MRFPRHLLLMPLLLAPAPAFAHAVLVGSTPALGGTQPPGPATIELRYNSRIDQGRSTLTLTTPDRGPVRLRIVPGDATDRLQAPAELTAPGAYNLRWQVLAVDGHITRGDVPFTVRAP